MLVELYNKRHSLETTCTGEEAVMVCYVTLFPVLPSVPVYK